MSRPHTQRMLMLTAAVTALVALPFALVYFGARTIIFHPTRDRPEDIESATQRLGFQRFTAELESGATIVGALRRASTSSAPTVVLFGGNASDLIGNAALLADISDGRADGLVASAYRGYDGSSGSPSEAALVADARALIRWLIAHHHLDVRRAIIAGQSLGTGVAVALTAQLTREGTPPRGLVLISPFRSITKLASDTIPILPLGFLIRDRFDSEARLPDLALPVLVVHGTRDRLIPFDHGAYLADTLGSRATLVPIEGAGHNDVLLSPRAIASIQRFIDGSIRE